MFDITMGVPEMKEFWDNLKKRVKDECASKSDKKLYKKLGKAFYHLSIDPYYPSLNTHEITELSKRYGERVWQSYLENNTPAAGRIYWVYGPNKNDITIIGLEPHPNTKSNSYKKIRLSKMDVDDNK